MKAAILFSGAARLGSDCIESMLSSLVGLTHVDMFFYCWEAEGVNEDAIRSKLLPVMDRRFGVLNIQLVPEYQHTSKANYVVFPETKIQNVFRMYKGIHGCDLMRRKQEFIEKIRYDVIIRTRSDVKLDSVINLRDYSKVLDDFLVLPKNGHWRGGYCDQFAIGSSLLMSVYSSVIDYIEAYAAAGLVVHPETILKHHCRQHAVKVLYGDFQTIIVR